MKQSVVQCPICNENFRCDEINKHVDECLTKGGSTGGGGVTPISNTETENERLFREFLANEEQSTSKPFQCPLCSTRYALEGVYFFESCGHFYCRSCIHNYVLQRVEQCKCSSLECPDRSCKKPLFSLDIKAILTDKEYELYNKNSLIEVVSNNRNFVTCPKEGCGNIIERVTAKPGSDHKEQYRFRCRECTTEFCAGCGSTPYHEGYTCDKFKQYKAAKHCRFCGDQLTYSNRIVPSKSDQRHQTLVDVCQKPECTSKASRSCTKLNHCNHNCCGIRGERQCLPCLMAECSKGGQTGLDFCNICWIEDLQSAPCIKLLCGHVFHFECVEKQITKKWPTTNITFGFCDCPLCGSWIKHPALENVMQPIMKLYEEVKQKAVQRLKFQNLENAKEIVTEGEMFYKNPVGYALKRFCYYPCFKCKKPYFGGERACNAEQRVDPNFNPEELICGSCSTSGNKQNCTKHGTDFIEWKCKFCCQVACWFCWGNTHFCEDCHKQATKISKVPRDQLPACKCKVKHPPNGEEYCFGCSLCIGEGVDF